jgi:hypothetical protein
MQAADSSSGRLQVKAYYAKEPDVEKESSIPVMVSIMAPLSGMVAERPPVDLVLVLNIQKGRPAPVKWRILLMEAVEVALGKLGDNDRIAVLADSRNRSVETTTLKSNEELKQAMSAKLSKEVEGVLMQVSNENCRRVQVSVVNKAIRSDTLVVTALESANSVRSFFLSTFFSLDRVNVVNAYYIYFGMFYGTLMQHGPSNRLGHRRSISNIPPQFFESNFGSRVIFLYNTI